MNKETRKALRESVLSQLNDDMMPLKVGEHTITDQYVYAGCSQWDCAGHEWDETRHDMAWIVDGQYQLTFPNLAYFDGHNQIYRQSQYYLQPDRAETPPDEPIGEPLEGVPDTVLLEIARALVAAVAKHGCEQEAENQEALTLVAKLGSSELIEA